MINSFAVLKQGNHFAGLLSFLYAVSDGLEAKTPSGFHSMHLPKRPKSCPVNFRILGILKIIFEIELSRER